MQTTQVRTPPEHVMLDHHTREVGPNHVAFFLELDTAGAVLRRTEVAVPTWKAMCRYLGRGSLPTLCLCEVHEARAEEVNYTKWISTRSMFTLSMTQVERLFLDGRVDILRQDGSVCRQVVFEGTDEGS